MLAIANFVAHRLHNLFSLEMWGGATFDVAMRFLHEDPFARLRQLREAIPNICFQMLLRASNAVGYTAYPDNVVGGIHPRSRRPGHRHLPHLRFAQLAAQHEGVDGGRAQDATRCAKRPSATPATSSIRARDKYSLDYYVRMAKELERMGAHILAIKDMAGLCRPYAAEKLVKALRQEDRHPHPLPYPRYQRHQRRQRV